MSAWTPNAFMYDFGRAMPGRIVAGLFQKSQVISRLAANVVEVYEPAAGTGRILVPLAVHFPRWHFTATDISADMLRVLHYKRVCEGIGNLTATVCDATAYQAMHDLVILSSFLHAIPHWQNVLDHITTKNIAPNGVVVFLGDIGDIYQAADGSTVAGCDKMLQEFWYHYFEARKQEVSSPNLATMQKGCCWDLTNTEPVDHLLKNGWREIESVSLDWQQSYMIADLITIIEQKCWSSMFNTPNEVYVRILQRLAPYLVTLDTTKMVVSRQTATLRFLTKSEAI